MYYLKYIKRLLKLILFSIPFSLTWSTNITKTKTGKNCIDIIKKQLKMTNHNKLLKLEFGMKIKLKMENIKVETIKHLILKTIIIGFVDDKYISLVIVY